MVERITDRIESLEGTESVTSITNTKDIRGADDGLEVEPFAGELPLSAKALGELARRLTTDPIVSGVLISGDATTTAVVGRLLPDVLTTEGRERYFTALETILAEEGPGITFEVTGLPHMFRTLQHHVDRDTALLTPMINVVFALLIWFAFGQRRMMWIALVPIYIAAMLTVGSLMLSGRPMTILTAQGLVVILIMVIGMCDCVHLIDRYRQEVARDPGAPRFEPLVTAIKHVGKACLLTSVTTAVGFSGLIASEIPTVRDFGIFGTLGVLYAFLTAVLLLPACIIVVERRWTSPPPPLGHAEWATRGLDAIARLTTRWPRVIIGAGVVVLVASLALIPRVRSEILWADILKPSDPALLAFDFLNEEMSGGFLYPVVVKGAEPDAVKAPAFLALLDEIKDALEALPYIGKVATPSTYLRKTNKALHEDREDAFVFPESREAVAQNLLLFEMAGGDNEFDRLTTYSYDVVRLLAYSPDLPSATYDELAAVVAGFAARAREIGAEVYLSSIFPVRREAGTNTVTTLVVSLAMALPLVFVVMMITFRSIRLGLISVLPNLLPIAVGMGMLGLTDLPLSASSVVAFPIAFGLAVDDTIHLLYRFNQALEAGQDTVGAVRSALVGTGRAMVLSTVFLIAGFSVFFAASYQAVINLIIILHTVLLTAIVGDLLVLPALLVVFAKDRTPAS